jgi:hypothetical protein
VPETLPAKVGLLIVTALIAARKNNEQRTNWPIYGKVDSRISTLQAIEAALTKAGVEFLSAGQKGEGVRLISPQA